MSQVDLFEIFRIILNYTGSQNIDIATKYELFIFLE